MTTTIHTARYNDQVFTRTSKSRTYSHVVLGRDSYELHLAGAQSKGWARTDAANYRWTVDVAAGRGEYASSRTPERIAKAQAELQGINSVEEYQAAQTARRVADVEARKAAGAFDTYGVIGWTSRLDLAQKLQGQSQARYGHVVIVEAERTTKEPKGQPKAAEAPVATEEAAPAAPEPVKTSQELLASIENPTAWDMIGIALLADREAKAAQDDDQVTEAEVEALAATYEVEQTREANQTTIRQDLTLEALDSILRRNGMLDGADSQGRTGLRRLLAALLDGDRVHTLFHSYKLVPIEPVKTSQELLAQPWDGLLVIEREDTLGLAYREEGLPETTVWLTRDILSKSSSWDGHRSPLITFDALMAGRRIHTSDKSYVLAQEEADEPSDAYQGEEQPPVIDQGDQDAIMAHNDQVIEAWADAEWTLGDLEVIDRPQDALQDAFDRWTEEEATQSWEQRLEAAQTLQERIAIAREVVRAARDAQVTQDELRGLTLVVSGAFVGTNGPKALTVDELHFMAACENQSARKVLERLKAGQVIEGSCTYRYLAEASSNAWAA